jgi:hypothetical protein
MEALFELIGALLELFTGGNEQARPTRLQNTVTPGAAPSNAYRILGRKRGRLYHGLWVRRKS